MPMKKKLTAKMDFATTTLDFRIVVAGLPLVARLYLLVSVDLRMIIH